jgi:hypothetical protein
VGGSGEREGWQLGMLGVLGVQKKKVSSFLGKISLTIITK